LQCWQGQTYQNRELLIVSDGQDVRDLVPDDDRIRLIHIEEGYTIGQKRNFGCEQACGEVIAHWDDDDWYAPDRLTQQIQRMQETGKAVTGYSSIIFEGDTGRWKYLGHGAYAVGTSLVYRKEFWERHKFPAKMIGEDGDFVREASQARELAACDGGEMIIASIHPGNTSKRQLTGSQWEKL
jgi:glycosyltransferase involved in cell wall biosynthesis